jgi:ABC-2 type transport system ATP-binding protein
LDTSVNPAGRLNAANEMIVAQGLRKLYDRHLAVDGVSFSLHAGQICGLVGPNGAGKTTTMRCLAGLIPATEGSLRVAGCSLPREVLELKRRLAYVPDDPPLFDDLSVGEHLEFFGRLYRVDDYRTKAADLLEQFELTEKFEAGATTLSRGMRQKLAICCAYLFSPRVLLLDEPLTGLDPPAIRRLLDSVRERAAEGTTVIISSHLLAMIEGVCSHLLVMSRGRAAYFGAKAGLADRFPQTATLEDAFFAATATDANVATPLSRPTAAQPLTAGA